MELWKQQYNDWVDLLKQARAYNLLSDSEAVWDEAFRQGIMLATTRMSDKIQAAKIQEELLK